MQRLFGYGPLEDEPSIFAHDSGRNTTALSRARTVVGGERPSLSRVRSGTSSSSFGRFLPLHATATFESWRVVQAQFVDDPRGAVASADSMIQSVMRDCGYPVEDFDQRASDLSVDHAHVAEHYREGHRLATESAHGDDSTEDLRHAMQHYRALFEELVDSSGNATDSTNDPPRVSAGKES